MDSEIERICLTNFSTDGVGVSKADADAVTDLRNVFSNNTSINTLVDLRNFTNLTINMTNFYTFSNAYLSDAFPTEIANATASNPFICNEI